jgi:hypothetical protein
VVNERPGDRGPFDSTRREALDLVACDAEQLDDGSLSSVAALAQPCKHGLDLELAGTLAA